MNSIHSLERAKERAGLNETRAVRFTNLAYERGKISTAMPQKEREYMESKEAVSGCKTVYYNDYLFIFSKDGTCITLYRAPSWFCHRKHYAGKEIIRDVKKYVRYCTGKELA